MRSPYARHAPLALLWLTAMATMAMTTPTTAAITASDPAPAVRVNQVAFPPLASKVAVVADGAAQSFEVVRADTGEAVFKGKLGAPQTWAPSAETVRLADFSALSAPGDYRIKLPGQPLSDRFAIRPQAYRGLNAAALKAYYFNRAGTPLLPEHAGAYARPAGHMDDKVLVHASAASAARAAGTVVSSGKGWYDAGDYNKYVTNSGITTYTLLAAYEHFPHYFDQQRLNIPESGNGLPDVLNEALWNLEWMLTMQEPSDGGVYHKLTNLAFDGMMMPHQAGAAPRYLIRKSTSATLNFAAVMATASRVLKPYERQRPGLSAKMLAAAEAAWKWAEANPAAVFTNPAGVVTGEYGDPHLEDEWAWAAAELYIGTGKASYYRALKADAISAAPSWSDVRGLAWMSLAHHRNRLTPLADRKLIAGRIDGLAASLAHEWKTSAYKVAMKEADFVWGSNAVALNQAMMLLQAYRLNGRADYLRAAQSGLDYVLGRNATGYSFVTGFGARPSLHPHHRPSEADQVAAPVPGWLTGGPQPKQQDQADCPVPYPGKLAALSYLDHVCSYASNEVAINWNAPLVYVSAALDELTGAKAP